MSWDTPWNVCFSAPHSRIAGRGMGATVQSLVSRNIAFVYQCALNFVLRCVLIVCECALLLLLLLIEGRGRFGFDCVLLAFRYALIEFCCVLVVYCCVLDVFCCVL